MSRTTRLWKGAGLLTLGGALLSGVTARGDDGPPLASQLNDLGHQALAQGANVMAQSFFQKALDLDPGNADATRGLKESKRVSLGETRIALQDAPGQVTPPPAPAAENTPSRFRASRSCRRRLPPPWGSLRTTLAPPWNEPPSRKGSHVSA